MTVFRDHPALLAEFRRGDRRALEQVYWAYVARVEAIVRHGFQIVRSGQHVGGIGRDEIADLVQETFARAFAERARLAYDGVRPYAPFLATIARNLLVDAARRRGREITVDELPEIDAPPADDEPWADLATIAVVEAYLGALPDELRGVHEHRYVRGRSQEDAARDLGLTRQQIRTLERRLRDGLANRLRAAPNQERAEAVGTVRGRGAT